MGSDDTNIHIECLLLRHTRSFPRPTGTLVGEDPNLNPEPLPGPTGANPSGSDRSDLARPAPPGDPVNLKKRLGRTRALRAACCFGRAEAAASSSLLRRDGPNLRLVAGLFGCFSEIIEYLEPFHPSSLQRTDFAGLRSVFLFGFSGQEIHTESSPLQSDTL